MLNILFRASIAVGGVFVLIGCGVILWHLLMERRDRSPARHASRRSFRKATGLTWRRRLTLMWQLHQDRSRNLRLRLAAHQPLAEAWECRYAPPMQALPAPRLPVGVVCHEPDTLDGLVLKFSEDTPNLAQGNWTPREIEAALPAWVIEALGGHSSVDSCIRATFPSQVNA